MIEDWGIGTTVANALGFSATAFATGAITTALGQVLDSLPGSPGIFAYVIFFVILPVTGLFSDFWEMFVRGLIFTLSVAFFSNYIFNDVGEVLAASLALIFGLAFAIWNESNI